MMTNLGALWKNRVRGSIVGLAVGDALGAPLEFSKRDSVPLVTDMIGGGPFNLAPGEWTDDTSMALCLMDSMIANGGFDGRDVIDGFLRWRDHGENSVTGRCFDIGGATAEGLRYFERTGKFIGEGSPNDSSNGNGSLMRVAPVIAFPDGRKLAVRQSHLTHAGHTAAVCCETFVGLLMWCTTADDPTKFPVFFPWSKTIIERDRGSIQSDGYSLHTMDAAIWAVGNSRSFEDALIKAVNLADDSDTVGAVTGQLAGVVWGYDSIPSRWLDKLAWRDDIVDRVDRLIAVAGGNDVRLG